MMLKRSEDALSELERYLQSQAALQAKRRKTTKTATVIKNDLFEKDKLIIRKNEDWPSKKRRKSKIVAEGGVKLYESIEDDLKIKPIIRRCSSGSEYIPSDGQSSSEEGHKKLKSSKRKRLVKKRKIDSNKLESEDSSWEDSDAGHVSKKKIKELDDGDIDLFTERIKKLNWNIGRLEVHTVCDVFKCPKVVWDKLYLYQQVAVKWFWELNQKRCGGILGDEMGLGKTVQLIAFLAGLHVSQIEDYDTGFRGLGPSIIVCPTTVMHQWVREFRTWYPLLRVAILHESGTYCGKDRSKLISALHTYTQGILITSYTALVQYQEKILSKNWHYVILDEGHKIRNNNAQVTIAAKKFDTPHRLILSGSPLQNNLRELWSLFDFVYPGKLGTLQAFTSRFQTPIVQGGYANASQFQVTLAYKCALILKDTITPYLLRRMKCDVDDHIHLPNKTEQILFCRLTDDQRHYYKGYVENLDLEAVAKGKAKMFVALYNMRKICNHPDLYSGGPKRNFTITLDSTEDEESSFGFWGRAGKMIVIETLLNIWQKQGHRVLLFTQGTKMLVILEEFVKRRGYKYLKLDGQTCISSRQPLIDKFNKDQSYFVMLLTTKVGGLGINLTGADRVVIYDPDWNPATDTQARERAWRIGQRKEVTIYRLITAGTIEEKIYHRQIFKQFLSNKVLKDPRQRRFFKTNDLVELFTLNETIKNGTNETAAIFAGTNSEIKFDSNNFDTCDDEIKIDSSDFQNTKITFSESKIEEMKKLAQRLSKKLENKSPLNSEKCNMGSKKGNNDAECVYGPDGNIIAAKAQELVNNMGEKSRTKAEECEDIEQIAIARKNETLKYKKQSDNNALVRNKKLKTESQVTKVKISHRKHKKDKYEKFEGKIVPHLLKCKRVKRKKENIVKRMSQDEYVLHNLFTKSGLETVLKHDTIMQDGPSDYALVEAEAEKLAQEAVKYIKESRAQVPQVRKPSFTLPLGSRNKQNEGSSLLEAIKRRNMILETTSEENQLAKQIVSWLSSQGGTASTDEIVNEFQRKVGPGKTPLFKTILSKIAQFYRAPDKIGYWTVRDEFK
ncbi:DNA excision repair protein ERCC-6-like isoform X2 [Rhodnius prolixus]|uniref:DNA excision repair protein ERCC-6-like isoform X2 n=2 Tax=Rhodnius prolixus TaxID=13249 RepID=UPI003D189970